MSSQISKDRELIAKASWFAYNAHITQKRKYTKLPYFTHCYDVAKVVETVTDNAAGIAAAFLHDVLEDTKTTSNTLDNEFGTEVMELVVSLSDWYTKERYPFYKRADRKDMEARRLGEQSPLAQTIKIADLIDNCMSIVNNDPEFAAVYLKEKELYLAQLRYADKHLRKLAVQIIDRSKQQLGING